MVVTGEMRGAGKVSSGVALPPVPKVTGSRRSPVRSWSRPLPYPIVIADRRTIPRSLVSCRARATCSWPMTIASESW